VTRTQGSGVHGDSQPPASGSDWKKRKKGPGADPKVGLTVDKVRGARLPAASGTRRLEDRRQAIGGKGKAILIGTASID